MITNTFPTALLTGLLTKALDDFCADSLELWKRVVATWKKKSALDPEWVQRIVVADVEDLLAEECLDTTQDSRPVRGPQPAVIQTPAPVVTCRDMVVYSSRQTRNPTTHPVPPTEAEAPPAEEEEEEDEDPRPAIAAMNRVSAAVKRNTEAIKASAKAAADRSAAALAAKNAPPPPPPPVEAFVRNKETIVVERHRRVKHKEPFIRALVAEVKCELGPIKRTTANVLVVRRLLKNRCNALKTRPKDAHRAIAIALELVFTPDEVEVDATVLSNSWAVRVQRAKVWYEAQPATFRWFVPRDLGVWAGALLEKSSGGADA